MNRRLNISKMNDIKEFAEQGKYDEAIVLVDSMDIETSMNTQFLKVCGEVYIRVERYEDAERILSQALDMSPMAERVVYSMVDLYITWGKYEEAHAFFDKFQRITMDEMSKQVFLYRMALGEDASMDMLIPILKAINKEEHMSKWMYLLAEAYYKNENYPEAARECDRLIRLFVTGDEVVRAKQLKQTMVETVGEISYDSEPKNDHEKKLVVQQQKNENNEDLASINQIQSKEELIVDVGSLVSEKGQSPSELRRNKVLKNAGRMFKQFSAQMGNLFEYEGEQSQLYANETQNPADKSTGKEEKKQSTSNMQESSEEESAIQNSVENGLGLQVEAELAETQTGTVEALGIAEDEKNEIEPEMEDIGKNSTEVENEPETADAEEQNDVEVAEKNKVVTADAGKWNEIETKEKNEIESEIAEEETETATEGENRKEKESVSTAEVIKNEDNIQYLNKQVHEVNSTDEEMNEGQQHKIKEIQQTGYDEIAFTNHVSELPEGSLQRSIQMPAAIEIIFNQFQNIDTVIEELTQIFFNECVKKEASAGGVRSNSVEGNFIIVGKPGSGKTSMGMCIAKALGMMNLCDAMKFQEVQASQLNLDVIDELFEQFAGGVLLISRAGELDENMAIYLMMNMEQDNGGTYIILEDTLEVMTQMMSCNGEWSHMFEHLIKMPRFQKDVVPVHNDKYKENSNYKIQPSRISKERAVYILDEMLAELDLTEENDTIIHELEGEAETTTVEKCNVSNYNLLMLTKAYLQKESYYMNEKVENYFEKYLDKKRDELGCLDEEILYTLLAQAISTHRKRKVGSLSSFVASGGYLEDNLFELREVDFI